MTTPASQHALLLRQVRKATVDGALCVERLLELVSAAYEDQDRERNRTARSNRLMAVELEGATAAASLQALRFRAALDNMEEGLCLFDEDGRLVVANRKFRTLYQLSESECAQGETLSALLQRSGAFAQMRAVTGRLLIEEHLAMGRCASIEQEWGAGRVVVITRTPVDDGGFLETVADVTEARQASQHIAHLARHDPLTNLPNRTLMKERLAEIVRNRVEGERCGLIYIDLDRFKAVNDTLGHQIGDALLVAIAAKLSDLVAPSDTVARLGGDEFAIVLQRVVSDDAVDALCEAVIASVSQPILIGGHHVQVGASLGVNIVPAQDLVPDVMLRDADLALYRAKADGKGVHRRFEPDMHKAATARRVLEAELREAIRTSNFETHYQPQITLSTGLIAGFEALVRWRHPVRGLIGPDEFIPICEEIGLIDALGQLVLREACTAARHWPEDIAIAVNVSALQFKSGGLPQIVAAVLAETGLAAQRLELEITESVIVEDPNAVLAQLKEIKSLGVAIALDDFGTGYSSLSYIRRFPFERVKIDRSFIRELNNGRESLAIVRAVKGLCGSLGLKTTAEGVETKEQLSILSEEDCDSVQGYLFSAAVGFKDTLAMLFQNRATAEPPKPKAAASPEAVAQVA